MKTKHAAESVKTFKEILGEFKERFHSYPKLVQADEGAEFKNKIFLDFLKSEDITFFTTSSKRKASVVERFNRTLKTKMQKMHEGKKSHEWVDDLPALIENYNSQEHSSIGMKPKDVNSSNQYIVWNRLYGHVMHHVKDSKFKVGDKVRVLNFNPVGKGKEYGKYYRKKYPEHFNADGHFTFRGRMEAEYSKRYGPFTNEIFVIEQVLFGDPIVYKLYSPEAELEILGKFYEQELSLVRDK